MGPSSEGGAEGGVGWMVFCASFEWGGQGAGVLGRVVGGPC